MEKRLRKVTGWRYMTVSRDALMREGRKTTIMEQGKEAVAA
jgi:hypothetical protein